MVLIHQCLFQPLGFLEPGAIKTYFSETRMGEEFRMYPQLESCTDLTALKRLMKESIDFFKATLDPLAKKKGEFCVRLVNI